MSPLSIIGSHTLALVFPLALFSALMGLIAHRRDMSALKVSAYRAGEAVFYLLTFAVILLVGAFLADDFRILYVYGYSSSTLPLFYKLTGLWAGLDGSILFWTWLVSLYAFIVLRRERYQHGDWLYPINATMMTVIMFFAALMIFANNPFAPNPTVMMEGKGLNPLLQNIAMVVHPPALYLGFTGFTVPFAYVIAALWTRRLDATWIDRTRQWTIIAWSFLTLGLILGGAWAYVELGWGGFWAWDPVENAALMPWLLATAYIHSVMIQKQRGMLMTWNVSLVILTFMLTIFGTYLTRSGVVQSVHAFSEGNLGPFFLGFLGLIFIVGLYLIVTRQSALKSKNVLDSWLSKESAFIMNNVVLLIAAFAMVWGTMFPTFSEAVIGERISVGAPFFNTMMAPIALALLVLMGVGPMISWRRARWQNIRVNLLPPVIVGGLTAILLLITGIYQWYVVSSASLVAYVTTTIVMEFYRGMRAIKVQKKIAGFSAFLELLFQSNRRYGGYVVHVGILVIFLGIAGSVYKTEADFALSPSESYDFAGYRFTYVEPTINETSHKSEYIANVDLYRGDKKIRVLKPAKFFFATSEQPTTEVDIYQAPFEDVYIVLGYLDTNTRRADFRVTLNPLISFIWAGGFIIMLGVILVLLPRTSNRKMSTALCLGLMMILSSASFAADAVDTSEMSDPYIALDHFDPKLERLKKFDEKLLCVCGDCVRTSLHTCTCDFARKERKRIFGLMESGKSDSDILASYVNEHGMQALTVPPQTGLFNLGHWAPWGIAILSIGGAFWLLQRRLSSRKKLPQASVANQHSDLDEYAKQFEDEMKD